MKSNLTALEIKYIVKEMQQLIDAKVNNVYHISKKELIFQLHISNKGKRILRVMPNYLSIVDKKASAKKLTGFCMKLRKVFNNSRIKDIRQIEFERVVEIIFETKEKNISLFIEMFGKGNIILVEDSKIAGLAEQQKFKDKILRVNEDYIIPRREVDFLRLNEKGLRNVFKGSSQESIVRSIAVDLGLGGVYAEEACLISGIDKNSVPQELGMKKIEKLFDVLEKMKNRKISARIILEEERTIDVVPFKLEYYSDYQEKCFESFNKSLIEFFKLQETQKKSRYEKEIDKIKKIIEEQKETISKLSAKYDEEHEKGEYIYNKYAEVDDFLKKANKFLENNSFKELKELLKKDKKIKSLNEKEKSVVVEIC